MKTRGWPPLMRTAPVTERRMVRTSDGWELCLRRIRLQGAPRDAPPVMMLHGLAANHHSFHFAERSMAAWMAARGHDVWIPELRGHGDSLARSYDWDVDAYLERDLPALISEILSATGAQALDWVGHSMGGVLLMLYGARHDPRIIRRGVTIASAVDYSVGETAYRSLLALRPLLEPLPYLPFGPAMRLLAPVFGRGRRLPERFHVWPPNIEPDLVRRIYARCFHTIPTSLLLSLSTTFETGGFRLATGDPLLPSVPKLNAPLLMLAGSKDHQVSTEAVAHSARIIGDNASVRLYGVQHGHAHDYGHFDLLLGSRAPVEVWPDVATFLEAP